MPRAGCRGYYRGRDAACESLSLIRLLHDPRSLLPTHTPAQRGAALKCSQAMQRVRCRERDAASEMPRARCRERDVASEMPRARCREQDAASEMPRARRPFPNPAPPPPAVVPGRAALEEQWAPLPSYSTAALKQRLWPVAGASGLSLPPTLTTFAWRVLMPSPSNSAMVRASWALSHKGCSASLSTPHPP